MIPHHGLTDFYSNPSPLNPTNTTAILDNTTTNNNVARLSIINSRVSSTSYDVNNVMNLQWHSEFPPGYRFCPKDEELIYYYLQRRILNLNLPHDKIKDVNLYSTTPTKLSEEYDPVGENDWYFFTPRDRKYKNGVRPNRAAGDGYWKATGADRDIVHPHKENEVIGHKKALVFYEGKSPKGSKTNWIMHEYRVSNPTARKRLHDSDMRLDDCVLCKIYNKNDKSPKGKIKLEINNELDREEDEEEEYVEEVEEESVAKDDNLSPEEAPPLYNPGYVVEDPMGMAHNPGYIVEDPMGIAHNPGYVVEDPMGIAHNPIVEDLGMAHNSGYVDEDPMGRGRALYEERIDCIDCVVKEDNYPPQLPHLSCTFPDISQDETRPIYDDIYAYQHGFDPRMNSLSFLQGDSEDEHNSTFLEEAGFNYKFIASPNKFSSIGESPNLDDDVVID